MSDGPGSDVLDDLAEEFARRCRAGERPSVEEYAGRYPGWEEDIRDLLEAVLMMERLKPLREEPLAAPAAPAPVKVPEQLGEYRILREIARGGMGVVYEALQEPLHRRVALKVLPAHLFGNETLRARFRREARAAARLHHTNIVPVFGVGEHDGLCFYAMQLIPGTGLDAFIRVPSQGSGVRDQGSGDRGQRSGLSLTPDSCLLTPGLVARIGVQVADALAYAHAQGVLHRDVKPSNLLLDAQGTAWVTDFGVAKLVEEANLTQSGDLVGTLRYMPPERFLGLSDARGDVYSLGITLYELLAHRPAFPDATPHHLIQMITQADPPPLRKLDPSIPTDLETVILKAVARDPAHRYQSATELADDLRRFLDDRPVLARRAGSVSLLWRWCRRNRVVASLSAAALSLLVLTSAVAVTAYLRTSAANRDKEAANAELKKALAAEQEQRGRAERTSASALQAMNRIYDRFAPNRLIATPRLPADGTNEEGGELPAQPVLPAEAVPLLEELLGFYEQLARDGSESPHLRLQAAEADQRIGDIRQRLGQPEQAVAAYRLALDLYSRPAAEAPDEGVRIKVARTYNELGRALRALQRPDEARQAHSQALATLADAPSEVAARPECQYELARTYYFQAEREVREGGPGPGRDRGPGPGGAKRPHPHHHGLDDFGPPPFPDRGGPPHHHGGPPGGPGSPPCDQAIALLEVLVKEHPAVPEYRHLLACCYRDAPPDRGPPGANAERALDLLRQLVKDCPKVPDYRYDLCETLARAGYSGQPLSAGEVAPHRQMLDDAITLSGALAAEYPNVPLYAATRALAHERLGALLARMSKPEEAERPFRKAVALQGALVRQHPEVAAYRVTLSMMQSALAGILTQRGDLKEAEKLLEEATQRLEAVLAKEPQLRPARRLLASGSRQRAEVLSRLGQTEKAAEARRKAEALGPERKFGPPGPGRRPE